LKWDELYQKGINVESISKESAEWEAMFSSACEGIASAQYHLGLWLEKVEKNPEAALKWLKKAAQKNFKGATDNIKRLKHEQNLTPRDMNTENITTAVQSISLSINEHNFQAAKKSLKDKLEKVQEDVNLMKVPEKEFFGIITHDVTGEELNKLTGQIQKKLINLKTLILGLIDDCNTIYQLFEFLDKDYISGIVASIKAAEHVSKKEQEDRKDIKKFKEDFDKLKHIKDIDEIWNEVKSHTKIMQSIEISLENQVSKINAIETDYANDINNLTIQHQEERNSIEKKLNALLNSTIQEHTASINKKMKLLYIVSGSAVTLAIIQFLFNIVGVI